MKNRIYIAFMLSITLLSCSNQNETETTELHLFGEIEQGVILYDTLSFFGNVKSFSQDVFNVKDKFGKITKTGRSESWGAKHLNFSFDESGCATTGEQNKWRDDEIYSKATFKYNKAGRIIEGRELRDNVLNSKLTVAYNDREDITELIIYDYDDEESSIDRKMTLKYDENGNVIEKCDYMDEGELHSKTSLKYDNKGNMLESCYFDSKGDLISKYTAKYNDQGKMIETVSYNSEGERDTRNTFLYDERGNKVEECMYYSDGSIRNKDCYKYDVDNNVIEIITYDSEGMADSKEVMKYDNEHRLLEKETYNGHGDMKEKITYAYDINGNLLEQSEYDTDGFLENKESYSYIFDEKGNWVNMIYYEKDIPKRMTERSIEYF